MKRNGKIWLISTVILLLSYAVCRYALFEMHGMKQWPLILLIVGGVIFAVSVLARSKYIPLFVSLGYPVAFAVGAVFQRDSVDPGGGATNSLWLIWAVAYLCIIAVGGSVEAVKRKQAK